MGGDSAGRIIGSGRHPGQSSREGTDRRLSSEERALYRWIIERFALARPPAAAQLAAQAQTLGLETNAVLATLAREDLVHLDESGAVTVAYPFSAGARGHEVTVDGRTVQAMCAIDVLGIAAMLDRPIDVRSNDPISGSEIRVHATPDAVIAWHPETAVVLAGSSSCEGPSYCGCCDVLNFVESAANAERYLSENPNVAGMPISIADAAGAGRAVFGSVLTETVTTAIARDEVERLTCTLAESVCVVTDDDGVVLGLLGRSALRAGEQTAVEKAMTPGPSTIRPSARLDAIRERMRDQKLARIIVSRPDGVLVGVLRVEDLGGDPGDRTA